MFPYVALGSYLATFLLFLIIYLVNVRSFKDEYGDKFSFLRHFPFELDQDKKGDHKFVYRAMLILIFALMGVSYILALKDYFKYTTLTYVISVFGILSYLSLFFLAIIDTRFVKIHLIVFGLNFLSTLVNILSIIFFAFYFIDWKIPTAFDYPSWLGYIVVAFSIIFVIALLIIMFNPKLKYWAKLEKQVNSDGTISYRRGKVFILALSEWLTILINHLSFIFILLLVLV